MGTAHLLQDWVSQQPLGESLVSTYFQSGPRNHRVADMFSCSSCVKPVFAEAHAELTLTNNLSLLGPTCAVVPKDDERCFCSFCALPGVPFFLDREKGATHPKAACSLPQI